MRFDNPATTNPIDQLKVVGHPIDRIDGPLKTTGTAPYAYERHDVIANQAYGYVVGAAIAKGRIAGMDLGGARRDRHRDRGERRQAQEGPAQYGKSPRRPEDRALSSGNCARGCGNIRTGARRRTTRASRLRFRRRYLRPRGGERFRDQIRAEFWRPRRYRDR